MSPVILIPYEDRHNHSTHCGLHSLHLPRSFLGMGRLTSLVLVEEAALGVGDLCRVTKAIAAMCRVPGEENSM